MACMPLFSPDQAPDGHFKNLSSSRAYNRRLCVGTTLKRSSTFRKSQGGRTQTALRRDCAAKFILVFVHTGVTCKAQLLNGSRSRLAVEAKQCVMQLAKNLDGERSTDTQVFFAPPREWRVARLQILSANPAMLVFAERLSRTRSTAGAAAARTGRSMDVTANAGRSGGRARDCRWAGLLRPRLAIKAPDVRNDFMGWQTSRSCPSSAICQALITPWCAPTTTAWRLQERTLCAITLAARLMTRDGYRGGASTCDVRTVRAALPAAQFPRGLVAQRAGPFFFRAKTNAFPAGKAFEG